LNNNLYKRGSLLSAALGVVLTLSLAACSNGDDADPHGASADPATQATEEPSRDELIPEPENPVVFDCDSEDSACLSVVDCNIASHKCVPRSIGFSVEDCAKKNPQNACENFAERLASVKIIADSYNFVSSAQSTEQLDVTYMPLKLKQPWDLEFLPDGAMLITQRDGTIHLVRSGVAQEIHKLETILSVESGLMGLAVDPAFDENRHIYVFYTLGYDEDPTLEPVDHPHKKRILNRISRFTLVDDALQDETVVLDAIPGSTAHTGGRLEFGPDGYLYATTGDAFIPMLSQDPDFLGGKILRLGKDGSVPSDNPTENSYVYSMGHRNPQGLAWHPENADLYASEHGPERYDEINRIEPGRNYGWGTYQCGRRMQGDILEKNYRFPLACFKQWTIGPSGMTFVPDRDSPWYGNLFVSGLRGKHLRRYVVAGRDQLDGEIFFIAEGDGTDDRQFVNSRIRDVEYFDGSLYVIGDFRMLAKLSPRTQPAPAP